MPMKKSPNVIHYSFSSFSMMENDFCSIDFLEIRKESETGELMAKYCGKSIPPSQRVLGNVWMRFKTHEPMDTSDKNGFTLHFKQSKCISNPFLKLITQGSQILTYI